MSTSTAYACPKSGKFDPLSFIRSVRQAGLPGPSKAILWALASRAADRGSAWPSVAQLAEDSGQGRRTVQRHTAELIKAGWIERTARLGLSNSYHLQVPEGVRQSDTPDKCQVRQSGVGGAPEWHGGVRQSDTLNTKKKYKEEIQTPSSPPPAEVDRSSAHARESARVHTRGEHTRARSEAPQVQGTSRKAEGEGAAPNTAPGSAPCARSVSSPPKAREEERGYFIFGQKGKAKTLGAAHIQRLYQDKLRELGRWNADDWALGRSEMDLVRDRYTLAQVKTALAALASAKTNPRKYLLGGLERARAGAVMGAGGGQGGRSRQPDAASLNARAEALRRFAMGQQATRSGGAS